MIAYKKLIVTGLLLLQAFSFCVAQKNDNRDSFSYIEKQFEGPDKEFGSAPLWVWNTKVTHAIIDSMLTEFKEQAFGGVFVHPRSGLMTPYLSEEWFELWKYAMQKAKQLGLDIWIYDENSYPSGFAGGHVPAEMPESFNQAQMLRMKKVNALPDTSEYFIALEKMSDGSFKQIPKINRRPAFANYYIFTKEFYYTSPWYGGFSYVDLMVPGVTEKFLDITMRKGYETIAGDEFGKTVKGIFSDEPNIEVWDTISVRWTPLLFSAFKQKWNYNLEDNLASLFEETGDYKKVRHNYHSILLALFIEHWSKPMNKYASEKNLEWTGHYWEHEWPSSLHVPDNMAMYAWHQRPGIDMLFNQFDEYSHIAQFGNIRSVKELSSVANQLGKKRTLSETYGGGGWELTFKDMKRLGDWEFVLGINTLNQHLAYMTMEGARKYDYPQSFSYHNPWWNYYKGLNEHFSRLSLALSTGKQKNDVLIIEPTTTAWMYYGYTGSDRKFERTGQQFQSFISRLEKAQVEYDLGSEDIIKRNGKITGDKFIIGDAAYKMVVIAPGTENINTETFLLLKKFKEQGGQVFLFDTLTYIDGKKDARLKKWIASCIHFNGLPALDYKVVNKYFAGHNFKFTFSDTAKGKLYHQRRVLADGELILLVNSSLDYATEGNFFATGKDAVMLNTQTGEINDYPEALSGKGVNVKYNIPAAGDLLLFIANKSLHKNKRNVVMKNQGAIVESGPLQIKRIKPNVLTLDFCDFKSKDTLIKNDYFYNVTDYLFKKNGFNDGDPWNTSVQFKDQTITRDTFKNNTGFEVSYHFTAASQKVSSLNIKAVAERPELWDLYINDIKTERTAHEWWLDKNFAVYNISAHVRTGVNTITLKAPRMSINAEIEPIYILGDFNLQADTLAWKIIDPQSIKPGSWKEQGSPLYGNEFSYSKEFTISNDEKDFWITPGKWKGTVAVLSVNGKEVTTLMGNEDRIDISDYVKPGINKAELIITGSLKNTLGPHYYHPTPGMVSPWHWIYIYKQIPGADYDLYDYGLMEDFRILYLP